MAYKNTNVKAGSVIPIPGGLTIGSQIIIRGRVDRDKTRFSINLKCGEGDKADIALHFNPRNTPDDVVVRNSFQKGAWKKEEKDAPFFPFNNGRKFTLRIVTNPMYYNIIVNNRTFVTFNHRIPPDEVTCLCLSQGAEYYVVTVQNSCRTPFRGRFPGGLKVGQSVRVRGMVTDDAKRFHVNFECDRDGNNVGLHFNPRQFQNDVVLNNKVDGQWKREQRGYKDSPFKPKEYFDLCFIALENKFNIYVNERFFTTFESRCNHKDIRHLVVVGDVNLMNVEILDPLPNDFVKEIPQGMENDDLVIVKGFFYAEGNKFAVNLVKGTRSDDNIALHFNPRRDEKEVVMNAKEGKWGVEERHALPAAMVDMVPFEVEIHAKRDKFRIFANDRKICDFKARDDIEQIRSVSVKGEAYIYEIKLLRKVEDHFTDCLPRTLQLGDWIIITGAHEDATDQFSVNLACGPETKENIAFHFNPRFKQKTVVRNTMKKGKWGTEERDQTEFPFKAGDRFELAMLIRRHRIRVFVNHHFFTDYDHRVDCGDITHINLSGAIDFSEPEFY